MSGRLWGLTLRRLLDLGREEEEGGFIHRDRVGLIRVSEDWK